MQSLLCKLKYAYYEWRKERRIRRDFRYCLSSPEQFVSPEDHLSSLAKCACLILKKFNDSEAEEVVLDGKNNTNEPNIFPHMPSFDVLIMIRSLLWDVSEINNSNDPKILEYRLTIPVTPEPRVIYFRTCKPLKDISELTSENLKKYEGIPILVISKKPLYETSSDVESKYPIILPVV